MRIQQDIPVEWVYLNNPNSNVSDSETADGFCKFIEKFYWRSRDDAPDELHIVFNRGNGKSRYKYIGVSRRVYEDAWNRAHSPGDYEDGFGSWFLSEVRDDYEFDRHGET